MRRRPDHDCHNMYPLWRPDSLGVAASFLKLSWSHGAVSWGLLTVANPYELRLTQETGS
jgi:hypothetical protein